MPHFPCHTYLLLFGVSLLTIRTMAVIRICMYMYVFSQSLGKKLEKRGVEYMALVSRPFQFHPENRVTVEMHTSTKGFEIKVNPKPFQVNRTLIICPLALYLTHNALRGKIFFKPICSVCVCVRMHIPYIGTPSRPYKCFQPKLTIVQEPMTSVY